MDVGVLLREVAFETVCVCPPLCVLHIWDYIPIQRKQVSKSLKRCLRVPPFDCSGFQGWRDPTGPAGCDKVACRRKDTSPIRCPNRTESAQTQREITVRHVMYDIKYRLPESWILAWLLDYPTGLIIYTSIERAMLRHCSMPGMSRWNTRRSLHFMVIVPDDPDVLHTQRHTQI